MQYLRKIFISWLLCLVCLAAVSQSARFSLATDVNVLRSIRKQQHFWAIGQTVTANFHFTPKEAFYVWFVYYTNGKFDNHLNADAKLAATTPQQIAYTNNAVMTFKQLSLGWKHYFIGSFDSEDKWNFYGSAGLGLMLGRVENTHSVVVDTATYNVPVFAGKANFKRLTFDIALGYEKPVGGDIFLYAEGRLLAPMTDYPSDYIYIDRNAPLTTSLNLGIRILFD
ncbi:MAG: hypothetical protein ABIR18_11835 [Chitinophagaceae bacterium]